MVNPQVNPEIENICPKPSVVVKYCKWQFLFTLWSTIQHPTADVRGMVRVFVAESLSGDNVVTSSKLLC